MTTITRERLEQALANPTKITFNYGETLELARIALASLEAEPVAIVEPSDYVTAAQLVGEEPRSKAVRPLFEGALSVGQKLYAAPRLDNPFCPKCGGTGLADSGGTHPCGEPISIPCDCTAPPATVVSGEYGDAYQGAREDLAIWKRRALEAEKEVQRLSDINDYLVKEAQGETRMGEPVIREPAPVVPEEVLADLEYQANHITDWHHIDEHSCKVNRRDLLTLVNACRTAMLQGQPVSNRDELLPGIKPAPELDSVAKNAESLPGNSPVIGWLRSDYNSDDKRDPNAPLFMLGSNDPSETWGVKYIPLSGNSPVIPDGYVMVPVEPTMAMLDEFDSIIDHGAEDSKDAWSRLISAAPQQQNAPQNIPEIIPEIIPGWIPVSERVPESNGVYFGWDGKRVLEVNCFFGGFSANQFIHGEITHWMPLPAAPQQEVK